MATKTLLKSGNIRVQFRIKGLQLISTTFTTEQEANAYVARIESELASIRDVEKEKLPIDLAAFYQTLHPDLKKVTQRLPIFARVLGIVASNELTLTNLIDEFVRQYKKKDQSILCRLKWWSDNYGTLKISEMSEDYVRQGINTLLTIGSTVNRPLVPATTNRFKANLSSVFEYGKNRYNLKKNPCRHVSGKPEGKGRKRFLTRDEQQQLLLAAKQSKWDKLYLIILMAMTCGARRGELEKLCFKDIDWNNARAFCGNTKNGSDKTLVLTDAVMLELKNFRGNDNEIIFSNAKSITKPFNFNKYWTEAIKQAGIKLVDDHGEKLVFHSLRHTFCSTLALHSIQTHDIAALAGHKSILTTMRYIHADGKHLASVVHDTFSSLG